MSTNQEDTLSKDYLIAWRELKRLKELFSIIQRDGSDWETNQTIAKIGIHLVDETIEKIQLPGEEIPF